MKCFLFSSNLSDPGGHSYLLTRKILMLIPSIGWSPWKDERICNNENQLRRSEHFFPTSAGFCRGQACHRTYFSVLWTSESPGSNWKTIGLKNIESSKFVDKRERKRVLFNEVYSLFAVFFSLRIEGDWDLPRSLNFSAFLPFREKIPPTCKMAA